MGATMLTLVGEQKNRLCDRVSRRAFLKIGALGGLTLADLLRLEAGQPAAHANRKSVILIFLEGGASHLDTYDLKPAAPAEYRVTGVMTFIVGPDGVVYEKDLGSDTLEKFQSMEEYNPDPSWKVTEDDVEDDSQD